MDMSFFLVILLDVRLLVEASIMNRMLVCVVEMLRYHSMSVMYLDMWDFMYCMRLVILMLWVLSWLKVSMFVLVVDRLMMRMFVVDGLMLNMLVGNWLMLNMLVMDRLVMDRLMMDRLVMNRLMMSVMRSVSMFVVWFNIMMYLFKVKRVMMLRMINIMMCFNW